MNNLIKCPHCHQEFEPTEALTHQIEEQVLVTLEAKHQVEVEEAMRKTEVEVTSKIGKEMEQEQQRSKKLNAQISELLEDLRKLRIKDEDRENEMTKKLMEEEEKIKAAAMQKAEDDHKLKDLEKDKKMADIIKANEELRKKLEQGSQQTQGETLELELETRLKSEFPTDTIIEIKKGQRGADLSQDVIDKLGRSCGRILYESKNAEWSQTWIAKLKEDQRQAKADLAVLVTVNLPSGVENFAYRDGIWIVNLNSYIPLAWSLRYHLVSLENERLSNEGKDEKMKVLYRYLTGPEFKNRIEGIVDSFSHLQDELETEKRYFNTKWARQEKEIRKVIDHTHGMYGDLQGVIGKSLPEIKSLELGSGDD